MPADNRVVLSSDHAAIPLRQAIAKHVAAQGWVVVDIGPVTAESTPYPKHGEAAARLVASGDCRLGIIPVSYTHLDVYKRQRLSRMVSSPRKRCSTISVVYFSTPDWSCHFRV